MEGAEEVLLSLHRSPAHHGQLEAWRADLKAFDELKNDHENALRRVRWEAYQVATLYAVFQGVIFTAVSQPNLLTCVLWWSPVFLSVSVSFATFLAIADKLYSIGEVQEDIKETGFNISAIMDCLDLVDKRGSGLDLETVEPQQGCIRDRLAGYRFIGSRYGISALVFLTSFSFLVAYFSAKTLCLHCPPCSL